VLADLGELLKRSMCCLAPLLDRHREKSQKGIEIDSEETTNTEDRKKKGDESTGKIPLFMKKEKDEQSSDESGCKGTSRRVKALYAERKSLLKIRDSKHWVAASPREMAGAFSRISFGNLRGKSFE